MEFHEYFQLKKEIQNNLLNYIDNEDDREENYSKLRDFFDNQIFYDNHDEQEEFLRMLYKIIRNHYRPSNYFNIIGRIFQKLKPIINRTFTEIEIFNIFKKNKLALLILLSQEIIKIDKNVYEFIGQNDYDNYFKPEIKQKKISSENVDINDFKIFDKKRQIGENDNYICELIRNDSIEEFVAYINRNSISLSSFIKSSIFETNQFLLKKLPNLIEYTSFFGSIQIFQYLILNGVKFTESILLYSIHGRKPDIIHHLEAYFKTVLNEHIEELLIESIKCHHNEIAKYLILNFFNECNKNIYEKSFRYLNYEMFPADLKNIYFFYDLCKYNYITMVKLLLNTDESNNYINEGIYKIIYI